MKTFKEYYDDRADDLGETPDVDSFGRDLSQDDNDNTDDPRHVWVYHDLKELNKAVEAATEVGQEMAKENIPWKYSGDADDEKVGFIWTANYPYRREDIEALEEAMMGASYNRQF